MKPLLLIVTETVPCGSWPEWHSIWCAPAKANIQNSQANEVVFMPEGEISTLCKALYALACMPTDTPVALITDDRWLLPSPNTSIAQACLSEPDRGMLFFPQHQQFVICAQNAIRAHNSALGEVNLMDSWHQASILGMDNE